MKSVSQSNSIRLEKIEFAVLCRSVVQPIGHRVLGCLLTIKKIDRSWDMCFLMQNNMGINVY